MRNPKKERAWSEALKSLVEGLEAAQDASGERLRQAVNAWSEEVKNDAIAYLGRPTWLLSKSIVDKVKSYDESGKIWAMAGFRFDDNDKRSPGYYGQFQEAGWRPAPYIQRTPDHFLRRAKADHMNDLHKRLEDALRGTLAELEKVVKANKGRT